MTRAFVPPGERAPERPLGFKFPIWVPDGVPPRKPGPRSKPRELIIGKPWPPVEETT